MKEKRLLNFSSQEPSVSNKNNTKKAISGLLQSRKILVEIFFLLMILMKSLIL